MTSVWDKPAYSRGYREEMAGVSWLANPYPENSTDARLWVDGKVAAIQSRNFDANRDKSGDHAPGGIGG